MGGTKEGKIVHFDYVEVVVVVTVYSCLGIRKNKLIPNLTTQLFILRWLYRRPFMDTTK